MCEVWGAGYGVLAVAGSCPQVRAAPQAARNSRVDAGMVRARLARLPDMNSAFSEGNRSPRLSTFAELARGGLAHADIAKLVDDGELVRLRNGVYAHADGGESNPILCDAGGAGRCDRGCRHGDHGGGARGDTGGGQQQFTSGDRFHRASGTERGGGKRFNRRAGQSGGGFPSVEGGPPRWAGRRQDHTPVYHPPLPQRRSVAAPP